MTDYLAQRQAAGLGTDRNELNAKFDALARHFGIEWLAAEGDNPLQILWKRRDALATNELLNFGDAVEGFGSVDPAWLKRQVAQVKTGDEGNRSGAILELLGLNTFLAAGAKVVPSSGSNPGYDGVVELPGPSSLLVSIKNHGMTSHEKFFRRHAKELDDQFEAWMTTNGKSGELRISSKHALDTTAWTKLKQDVRSILAGQLDGSARSYQVQGEWHIVLKAISAEFEPLSRRNSSSIFFIMAPAHKNEQNKFVEALRKGCANIVKHTKDLPNDACRVLFVRLCASASIKNCTDWARDYFHAYPNEKVGLIILYQAVVVNAPTQTSLSHYILPILGPQFQSWSRPGQGVQRRLPNLTVLVGVVIGQPSRKVIQADGTQIPLDNVYTYQRGDIYRFYKLEGTGLEANLSNPAPGIMIHAEIESPDGSSSVMKMIASEANELLLLP